MHDPAYKQLFARPRMVRDLLDGFVARGWSDDLDLGWPPRWPGSPTRTASLGPATGLSSA